ncbi:MAG: class I SAM-dependent methyltransferase [Rhizobiaceae bacterium]|nr:class I SAM-dependent methyltransferase [Rhizobiaceae bacterium]
MSLSPPQVFDEKAALLHRLRGAAMGEGEGKHFLLKRAADDLVDRLAAVQRPFPQAVGLFSGTETIRQALSFARPKCEVTLVEAHPLLAAHAPETIFSAQAAFGMIERRFDLAVSLLAMQSINDLPGFLVQARRLLRPDGLFIGCQFGAGTLSELRDVLLATEADMSGGASPRVHPFADVRDMGGLLQRAGLALPVADVDEVTVRYGSIFSLIADLRAMGLTNALLGRSRTPLTRRFWARAAELYAERHADFDGRLRATFNIIWVSGWAPDASQQKPLRPGSAAVSLKDVI